MKLLKKYCQALLALQGFIKQCIACKGFLGVKKVGKHWHRLFDILLSYRVFLYLCKREKHVNKHIQTKQVKLSMHFFLPLSLIPIYRGGLPWCLFFLGLILVFIICMGLDALRGSYSLWHHQVAWFIFSVVIKQFVQAMFPFARMREWKSAAFSFQ